MIEFTVCPREGCGLIAEIEDRSVWDSTDGPVEHVKVRCAAGHWFYMPAANLTREEGAA